MIVRLERLGEEGAISALIAAAFTGMEHSDGTESAIMERLRQSGALTLSLVAEQDGRIVGHVALSPVTISDGTQGWHGIGPLAVAPELQRSGVGSALMAECLAEARTLGVAGCVVLGDPEYYGRFGFAQDPRLIYPGPPPEYFQCLPLDGPMASGTVSYHAAFG